MSDTSLLFNILARDKASGVLKQFGSRAHLAMTAGAAAAVMLSRDAIRAASDLAETTSKTEVLFGSSAAAVQKFAAGAAKSMGQSKQEALDAAATFAVFGKGAGLAGQELVKFSTGLTSLASDMASFSNTTPQEAIEAIGAALRGESDPIEKYGVLLNEATIAARALSIGLVKANVDQVKLRGAQIALTDAQAKYAKVMKDGKATDLDRAKASHAIAAAQQQIKNALGGSIPQLTAQQRVMAAQAEIMAQTKAAQGDFARTSTGLANRQRILAAEWENAKTTLGARLLPAMLQAITAFQGMLSYVQQNRAWLVPLALVLGSVIGLLYLVVGATKAWTAVQTAFNVVMSLNPVVAVTLAIIALVGIIVLIATKTQWFQRLWGAAWGGIKAAAGAVFGWIPGAANGVVRFIGGLPGRIGRAASGMWDGIKNAFKSAINWIISRWNNLGFSLPSVDTHIPGVGRIGGWTLSTPNIPLLDIGGDVLRTGLAVIHQGERVVPAAQTRRLPAGGGGGTVIEIRSDGTRLSDLLLEVLRQAVRVRGGDVQLVLGGRR